MYHTILPQKSQKSYYYYLFNDSNIVNFVYSVFECSFIFFNFTIFANCVEGEQLDVPSFSNKVFD